MPRNLDVGKEHEAIKKAVAKGENGRRQFVARFDYDIALLILANCLHENKQPGPWLEEIITKYCLQWQHGAHLELPTALRRAVDVIAHRRGKTREAAIIDLLQSVAFKELEAITADGERQEELLKRAEKLVGVE